MSTLSKLVLAIAIGIASMSFATANQPAEVTASMSEGDVRKVDRDAGKITIRHGELKNLDMPPMTMVFRVKDPTMLDQVKAGDRIHFIADKVGGQFIVIKMEANK